MDKTLSMLGLARRAGKLLIGHDAVFDAVKRGRVKLVLLTSDASARHRKELISADYAGALAALKQSTAQAGALLGKQSCVFALEDEDFASAVMKTICEEEITVYGSKV
ncbi:MAG: ribosomal L7Ae/L30e/S12e/Gadd45 family protein [Clostridia bacterium]|nr:ribosomal L7Ae/L30e/S12e/Gadd45 family protein [Clostridia bacterium]